MKRLSPPCTIDPGGSPAISVARAVHLVGDICIAGVVRGGGLCLGSSRILTRIDCVSLDKSSDYGQAVTPSLHLRLSLGSAASNAVLVESLSA